MKHKISLAPGGTFAAGSWNFGQPHKLFGNVNSSRGYRYAPTADGQKFIISQGAANSSQPLTVIQNWPALPKT